MRVRRRRRLLPAMSEKERFIKRLGSIADVPFGDQLEIDYVRLAAFPPLDPVGEWNKKPDPTPEEIKATCAEIRETWDKNRWRKEDMRKGFDFPVVNTIEIGL